MTKGVYDTHHTIDPDWPLTLALNDAGQSVYACIDCGEEIPDGCAVERDSKGHVTAWLPAGDERTVVHECAARRRKGGGGHR